MTVQELWEALDRLRLEGYASCDVVFSIDDRFSDPFRITQVDEAYGPANDAGTRERYVELS